MIRKNKSPENQSSEFPFLDAQKERIADRNASLDSRLSESVVTDPRDPFIYLSMNHNNSLSVPTSLKEAMRSIYASFVESDSPETWVDPLDSEAFLDAHFGTELEMIQRIENGEIRALEIRRLEASIAVADQYITFIRDYGRDEHRSEPAEDRAVADSQQ